MRGEEAASTSRSGAQEVEGPPEVEISEELMAMPEAELNRCIARAQEELRLQRKRSYLAAIERGEQPTINPFGLDEPTTNTEPELESPPRRRRGEGGARIQLTLLKYNGGSYAELQNFLFELENRFARYDEDFRTDNEKVAYAVSSLTGPQKTRWRTYVNIHHPHDIVNITWDEMSKWLTDGLADSATCSLEAVSKLHRLHQKDDQSFNQFLDIYEAIEAEMSYDLPAMYRVCSLLDALKPSLRTQVVSMGIPAGRQELLSAARRAESLLRSGQSQGQPSRTPAAAPRPPTTPNPAPPAPLAQTGRSPNLPDVSGPVPGPATTTGMLRGSCYRCGEPGHYANACLQARCSRCGRMGHSDSRCPEPVSSANATPVARHAAPDP
jgi:hypothetical protein